MATYPVIHKETGEQKEVKLSIHDWDQWLDDNPQWHRDWSVKEGGNIVSDMVLGDWKSRLTSKHPGWKQVLDNTKKITGNNLRNLY